MADGGQSKAELEDVLSSIRRLVSQNATAEASAALVLTEAERVLDEDEDVLRPAPQPAAPIPTPPSASEDEDAAIEAMDTRRIAEKLATIGDGPSEISELDASGVPENNDTFSEAVVEDSVSSVPSSIDMNALREIVTDIVREELRGPLGQKITRNVRKLVRQEIHRAANVKSLD